MKKKVTKKTFTLSQPTDGQIVELGQQILPIDGEAKLPYTLRILIDGVRHFQLEYALAGRIYPQLWIPPWMTPGKEYCFKFQFFTDIQDDQDPNFDWEITRWMVLVQGV